MKFQLFSGKTIAWFQSEAVDFYNHSKTQKLWYSFVGLLLLLIIVGMYVQGLRQGYVAGSQYTSSTKSLASASMSVVALEYMHNSEIDEARKLMEVTLDGDILSTFWTGLHLSVPGYMPFHSSLNTEEQQKSWESSLTRIAVYRKTHKSSSSWLLPGQSAYNNLMKYLPPEALEQK